MNVALSIKESQFQGVLEVLTKTGDTLDIIIDIRDGESEAKDPSLTTGDLYRIQEEVQKQHEQENKEEEVEEEEVSE